MRNYWGDNMILNLVNLWFIIIVTDPSNTSSLTSSKLYSMPSKKRKGVTKHSSLPKWNDTIAMLKLSSLLYAFPNQWQAPFKYTSLLAYTTRTSWHMNMDFSQESVFRLYISQKGSLPSTTFTYWMSL